MKVEFIFPEIVFSQSKEDVIENGLNSFITDLDIIPNVGDSIRQGHHKPEGMSDMLFTQTRGGRFVVHEREYNLIGIYYLTLFIDILA